jgi:hypothetical protein
MLIVFLLSCVTDLQNAKGRPIRTLDNDADNRNNVVLGIKIRQIEAVVSARSSTCRYDYPEV